MALIVSMLKRAFFVSDDQGPHPDVSELDLVSIRGRKCGVLRWQSIKEERRGKNGNSL